MADERGARRVSEADRTEVVEALGAAFAAGRLSSDEHEDRVELALVAVTETDLEELTADLSERPVILEHGPRPRLSAGQLLLRGLVAVALVVGGWALIRALPSDSATDSSTHTETSEQVNQRHDVSQSDGSMTVSIDPALPGVTTASLERLRSTFRDRFGDPAVAYVMVAGGSATVMVVGGKQPGGRFWTGSEWTSLPDAAGVSVGADQTFRMSDLRPRQIATVLSAAGSDAASSVAVVVHDGLPEVTVRTKLAGAKEVVRTIRLR